MNKQSIVRTIKKVLTSESATMEAGYVPVTDDDVSTKGYVDNSAAVQGTHGVGVEPVPPVGGGTYRLTVNVLALSPGREYSSSPHLQLVSGDDVLDVDNASYRPYLEL